MKSNSEKIKEYFLENIHRTDSQAGKKQVLFELSLDQIATVRSKNVTNLNIVPCLNSFAKNFVEDEIFDNLFPLQEKIDLLPIVFYFD